MGHKANECTVQVQEVEGTPEGDTSEAQVQQCSQVDIGRVWNVCLLESLPKVEVRNRFGVLEEKDEGEEGEMIAGGSWGYRSRRG